MRALCLFASFLIFAGCSTTKLAHPYLYEFSKDDKTGYLFGTIRVDVKAEELPSDFWTYFDPSDVLATEADLNTSARVRRRYAEMSHRRIKDLVTPSEYQTLEDWSQQRLGEAKAQVFLETATPQEVFSFAALARMSEAHPTALPDYDFKMRERTLLDDGLQKRARNQKKKFKYLDDQLDSMLDFSCVLETDEQVTANIKRVLDGEDLAYKELQLRDDIAVIYRRGDSAEARNIEKLDSLFRPDQHSCLVKKRNENWLPEIDQLMAHYHHPFIAVGVTHIETDTDSLRELLTARGYDVKRVDLTPR